MELSSTNNEKVKMWQKLKQKKYRDELSLFLVEDDHLVNEALRVGIVKEIITTDKTLNYHLETYYVNDKIMKLLSSQVTSAKVIAVCSLIKEKKVEGNVLVLDNLQDPGNLGTIIRSAIAFNFKNIFLSNDSVDVYNPKVIRASEGMIFHVNIVRGDIINFLNKLDNSYLKVTTSVKSGDDIKDLQYQNIALVIGNEGSGVTSKVANICERGVYLKMAKDCESLNASIAASILMYEVYHG